MHEQSPGRPLQARKWLRRLSRPLSARDLPIDPDLPEAEGAEPPGRYGHGRAVGWTGLAAVAAGGFIGSLARYGLEHAVPGAATGFPLTTWLINTSGAFALGVIMTVLVGRRRSSATTALVRAFTCTGALGAWTTVSTFAGETDALVRAGKPSLAAGYLMATLASGIAGTTAGMILARAGSA